MAQLLAVAFAVLAACIAIFAIATKRRDRTVLAQMACHLADVTAKHQAREKVLEDRFLDATNRLLAAWKDGLQIPASDLPPYVDPRSETPLDKILLEWLDQYTGDARAKYERIIRSKLGKMSSLQILKEFELQRDPLST